MTNQYAWLTIVTAQVVAINCGVLTITVTTKFPNHLWLLVAYKEPWAAPVPPQDFPPPRVHRLDWQFAADFGLEQQEIGDTLTHTFVIHGIMPLGRLYYMFLNINQYHAKLSQSPIFAVDIIPTTIATETWKPGVTGDWGWTLSYPIGTSVLASENSIVQNNDANLLTASQGVNLTTIPGLSSLTPCNAFIAITPGPVGQAFRSGRMVLSLVQQRLSPAYSITATVIIAGNTDDNTRALLPQDIPNPATGPIGYGEKFLILGQLFNSPQNTPTSGTFPFDPTVPVVALNLTCANTSLSVTPQHSSARWGQIRIGTIGTTVARVDKVWRTLAAPIFKIFDIHR